MPTILLIRHGQASYGTADYDELSPRGREQASAVAQELIRRGVAVRRISSGTLRRQQDTAGPVAAALGLPVTAEPRFNEYEMDDILAAHGNTAVRTNTAPGGEVVSSAEYQKILERAMLAWIAAAEGSPCPETWPQFAARTNAALTELARSLTSGTAVVSTSAGVIAALCCEILGVPAETMIRLNRVSVNGSITKLTSGRSGISFVSFNEHAHLEYDGSAMVTLR